MPSLLIGLSPTQDQIQGLLASFLMAVLPAGIEIVQGQDNRVPEPQGQGAGQDFVVITCMERPRQAMNVDQYVDAQFTASISGVDMTVSAVAFGVLAVGLPVFGVGVADGTKITQGSGGVGAYKVSPSQNVSLETMAAGVVGLLQPTRVVYMLDAHGDGGADNAQRVATAFKDLWAVDFFRNNGDFATPLFAEDPRQLPFLNENQQVENRWGVRLALQANQVLTVPQQFATKVDVARVAVDAFYPAS